MIFMFCFVLYFFRTDARTTKIVAGIAQKATGIAIRDTGRCLTKIEFTEYKLIS